ncbi:MAG: winged helix-turn-helix domain-containing protein [Candidatus Acidiferrales bacterium]
MADHHPASFTPKPPLAHFYAPALLDTNGRFFQNNNSRNSFKTNTRVQNFSIQMHALSPEIAADSAPLARLEPRNRPNQGPISNRNSSSFKNPAKPAKINPKRKSNRHRKAIPPLFTSGESPFTTHQPASPAGESPLTNHNSVRPANLSSFRPRSTFIFPAISVRHEVPAMDGLRFDAYQVDLRTGELRKHGRKIRLAGRPFQILALLLEQPGELLTRKELQERLWPADTFVDFEHGVNAAVQTLRRALCDSHKNPRFIETLPRRGYRFIATVEKVQAAAAAAAATAASPAGSPPPAPPPPNRAAVTSPDAALVGQIATIRDDIGRNYVLLPVSEEVHAEMCNCETSNDALAISLLVASEKLLLVNCGTRVQILDASKPALGCKVRILGGQFVGEKAFAPRACLAGLS